LLSTTTVAPVFLVPTVTVPAIIVPTTIEKQSFPENVSGEIPTDLISELNHPEQFPNFTLHVVCTFKLDLPYHIPLFTFQFHISPTLTPYPHTHSHKKYY
jgi:hypothetical protein